MPAIGGDSSATEGGGMPGADDDPRARQLGEYIRLQRQMADLSLRGMAELTKVSNAYLSQVERGLHHPSLRVLQAIAEALNIPADALLAKAGVGLDDAEGTLAGRGGTEAAIRSDPDLTSEEREALVRVYRSFVDGRKPTA